MLKRRVMIGLMFDDGVLTRTKCFRPDYRYTQQFLAVDAIDEAILVDVTRGGPSRASQDAIGLFAERAFAPVTIGGGLKTLVEVGECFKRGGDKVVIGGAALENPGFITEIAMKWGSQAVVVACDVLNGEVVNGRTGKSSGKGAAGWAKEAEAAGAGEIYLQDVVRDGSLGGFAIENIAAVASSVGIPVIVGSGCGSWRHMQAAFEAGADGAVTHCVHHWTETALMGFKRSLREAGVEVRAA